MRRPRILVTRSARQAPELAERLTALGADAILIPVIETVAPTSYGPLDAAIALLVQSTLAAPAFHWLVFTSANAVAAFQQRLEVAGVAKLPGHFQVAAVGRATADALASIGLVTDIMPAEAVSESLAEALVPYAIQPEGSPTRFLLVRAESGSRIAPREVLPDTLNAAGGEVTIVAAYRTVTPQGSAEALRELFSSPAKCPDAITFTSSSSVSNLLALLAEIRLTLPMSTVRISIGRITSATLREAGFSPHAEAEEASMEALAGTAVRFFHNQQN